MRCARRSLIFIILLLNGVFVFDWLFGKDLNDVLNRTKKIKVRGIRFTIRKVNLANYLEGTRVLLASHDTHKTKGEKDALAKNSNEEKIKEHFRDILIAGVVSPKLVYKEEQEQAGEGVWVEKLFTDWELVTGVHSEILELTYGKKKFKQATTAAKDLSS